MNKNLDNPGGQGLTDVHIDYAPKNWMNFDRDAPLVNQKEGKFMPLSPEEREEVIAVFSAEVLVKDYILPGRVSLEDCEKNIEKLFQIVEYLYSYRAGEDIIGNNLQELQMIFDKAAVLRGKIKDMVKLFASPEYFVIEFILFGDAGPEDFEEYSELISEIRKYLNSKVAEQNSRISKPKLQAMRKAFDLPGLVGGVEHCFDEVDAYIEMSEAHPKDSSEEAFNEAIDNLQQRLFELDQRFDSSLTQKNFNAKLGNSCDLKMWYELFQNIQMALKKREASDKRMSFRKKFLTILKREIFFGCKKPISIN